MIARKVQSIETGTQTTTGGRDEYSKALERNREKELGKLVPLCGLKSTSTARQGFTGQVSSVQGSSAPTARQRCVADGKQVNIPAPSYDAMGGRIA